MTLETQDLSEKWEEERRKIKFKIKIRRERPLKGTGLHVDPKKMAEEFNLHSSADGRPPIGGAQDD